MEILRLLSTIDVPISAARIQGELNLPRSSTYHLLAEMVDAGFVAHLPEHKTYGPVSYTHLTLPTIYSV